MHKERNFKYFFFQNKSGKHDKKGIRSKFKPIQMEEITGVTNMLGGD